MGSQYVVQVKRDNAWKTVSRFDSMEDADKAQLAAKEAILAGGVQEVRILESYFRQKTNDYAYKERYSSGPLDPNHPPPVAPHTIVPASEQPSETPSPGADVQRFNEGPRHESRLNELIPIYFKNLALTLLTLSGYRFWARTHVRRLLWGHTRFLDDPMVYLGRPQELLVGFLLVLVFVFLPVAVVVLVIFREHALGLDEEGFSLSDILLFLLILYLAIAIPFLSSVALYSSRRYRLSRSAWRGIRGTVTGSAWGYGFLTLWCLVLMVITLGWYFPWMRMRLARRRIGNSRFGDLKFKFNGNGGDLLGAFFIFLGIGGGFSGLLENIDEDFGPFLAVILYWLCLLAYRARELKYIAAHSRLGNNIYLKFTFTELEYIRFVLGNALISILTLTTGWAFLQRRQFQFWQQYLVIRGSLDPSKFRQGAKADTSTGEGLADIFDQDIETGFDVGF